MPTIPTSTHAYFERATRDFKSLRAEAEKLQTQIDSGERLTRSSDDPVAASRLRALSRLQQFADVDKANAGRVTADLSLADKALQDIATAVTRAQELATQAANETLTSDQRQAIAAELDQIHAQLFSLSNTNDTGGHALFGGETDGPAYTLDAGGNAVYVGTGSAAELPLGDGQTVTRSITGPQFLNFTNSAGNPTDLMATVKALSDALKGGPDPTGSARTAIADLGSGLDTFTTSQAVIGTRLAWVETTDNRRVDLAELRSSEEADIGGTDLSLAIVKLQETTLVLQASQASFTQLSNLSLLDKLR